MDIQRFSETAPLSWEQDFHHLPWSLGKIKSDREASKGQRGTLFPKAS